MHKSHTKILTVEQFNKALDELDFLNIEVKQEGITIYFIFNEVRYLCSLTGKVEDTLNTGNIMNCFNKYVNKDLYNEFIDGEYGKKTKKIDNFHTKVSWSIRDPGNYIFYLDSLSHKWLKCYSYDINSSYSYAMTKPMPNTKVKPKMYSIVKENEMGFYITGAVTTEVGAYADYIFPLVESPFKDYVNRYYAKKQNAKTKAERETWKKFLNIPTGMMHKRNIFIRNAILYYAKEYIRGFMDDETVYCNTDSIVSLKRRPDIPLGNELGQFKEEHINDNFKYIQSGIYQWNNECHYTGIPIGTLTDIENIDNWQDNLPYKYDTKTRRIVENVK